MITLFQLKEICPKTKTAVIEKYVEPLNAAMDEWEIDSPQRQAAFLAQVAHESGGFHYTRELASGEAYEGRKDLGNTDSEAIRIAAEHGSTPGRFFRGVGPIQITGFFNLRACGAALGLDVVNNPGLLEIPEHGCRAAGWFWWSRKLNGLADAGNFRAITLRVNGGLNGWQDRLAYYERAQETLA